MTRPPALVLRIIEEGPTRSLHQGPVLPARNARTGNARIEARRCAPLRSRSMSPIGVSGFLLRPGDRVDVLNWTGVCVG